MTFGDAGRHLRPAILLWVGVLIVGLVTGIFALVQWITWPDVARLASEPPTGTAFMDAYRARRRASGEDTSLVWQWVPWDRISIHAKRAVVAAEDMEFFSHNGFSSSEMQVALQEALAGERFRGASTITQQLAKNLWLSPSRNPWRKVKEALLTRSLERRLTKHRILEIYLNVVEFGPGIYGIEAAARHYFGRSAGDLTEHEAAMLAASLPRPSRWHPGVASTGYANYVSDIEGRLDRATFLWRALGAAEPPPPPPPVTTFVVPDPDSLARTDTVPASRP